jgi:hypothetical protein
MKKNQEQLRSKHQKESQANKSPQKANWGA